MCAYVCVCVCVCVRACVLSTPISPRRYVGSSMSSPAGLSGMRHAWTWREREREEGKQQIASTVILCLVPNPLPGA
ncbi:hypothetical protein K431DRAFT_284090 [Polychaeton citri CBS 116435]|uniref:Secreted protein n=1 Tax=Polychaeton citri CBS 116435 TaxID=1314669 RepID=A0A9P4Q886_9PEZI|nr:hypothetical protein K431DRAFT_284090 [Polychaeton citri CBS 116435]